MGEEHYIDIYLKRAIKAGYLIGPRLLVSGKQIVASNGHGVALTTADGEAEIRKLARRNLAMGADLIKIFVTGGVSSPGTALSFFSYTPQEVEAAVEEAKRAGTYVAAHAHGGRGLDICIEKGVRTIEHGAFVESDQIEYMKSKDMWIVGTFSILFHPEGIEKADFATPKIREKVFQAREVVAKNWRNVIASGLNFALGTDSMHGMMGFEAEYLRTFGASEHQAIQAVTRDAARACGIETQFGTLEEGKIADFVAVPGDPLKDIKNLQKVTAVYMGGNKVYGNLTDPS
jgi:imidazolonepropionase-like amidohydrolase